MGHRSITLLRFVLPAILVAAFSAITGATYAASDVHLILVSDHADPDLGEGFEANTNSLANVLISNFARGQIKITEVCQPVAGPGNVWKPLTAEMVRNAIKRVPVDSDDTLIVYLSCHGYFDPAVGNYFAFAEAEQGFSRQSIINEIKARNPRLGGIITDACQNYKRMPLDEESQASMAMFKPATARLMRSLFLEHSGFLDWSAAAEGEFAVYYNNYRSFLNVDQRSLRRIRSSHGPGADPPYKGTWQSLRISSNAPGVDSVTVRGGLFTEAFVSVANDNMDRSLTWHEFHELVKRKTASEYKKEVPDGQIDVGGFSQHQPEQTVTLTAAPVKSGTRPGPPSPRPRPKPPVPDPMPDPGPRPLPPPPDPTPAKFEIAGRWRCSCGDIWNLTRNGQKVTGTESNDKESADVNGVFDGKEFRFLYRAMNGSNGNGVMVPGKSGTKMAIRIAWNNGTTTDAIATRIENSPAATIAGRWQCSCGQVWTLAQNGNRVTGSESRRDGGSNSVSGTFDGSQFIFSYADPRKGSGSGIFNLNSAGSKMNGRIDWQRTTTPSTPTLTRF